MPTTSWNDAEDAALQGLPLAAQALYLRGLRRWMDYATGVVGRSRRISWQMLREVMYVEPHKGMQDTGTPHESKVRRLMAWLIRGGLVEDRGDGDWLIYFLPLADTDFSDQKKADRKPTSHDEEKADTPPVSGIRETPVETACNVEDLNSARARGEMAKALREAGVKVTSQHPTLTAWLEQGLSVEFLMECVALARVRKPGKQPIAPGYLDAIVQDQKAPQQSGTPEWARMPRRDEELEQWARRNGYSGPGVGVGYPEYRRQLQGEVEARMRKQAEG